MCPYIHLFGKTFSAYNTICAAACLAIPAAILPRGKRFGLRAWQTLALCAAALLAGFAGCRFLFLLENYRFLAETGWHARGVSFFGCLLFAPPILLLLARFLKIAAGTATDLLAFGLPPFLGIVRIGCYCGGCCGGIPRLLANGRIFVLPTQLIECGFDFLIFAAIAVLEKKRLFDGFRLPVFFVLYAPVRFALEFFRDTEKNIGGLSLAQLYAAAIFLLGTALLLRRNKTKRKG